MTERGRAVGARQGNWRTPRRPTTMWVRRTVRSFQWRRLFGEGVGRRGQGVRSISLAWLPCQKLPVRYSSQKFYSWRKQYSKFCLLISRQLSENSRRSRSEVRAASGSCLAPGVGRHAASASVQLPDQLSVCLTDTLTHTHTGHHTRESVLQMRLLECRVD